VNSNHLRACLIAAHVLRPDDRQSFRGSPTARSMAALTFLIFFLCPLRVKGQSRDAGAQISKDSLSAPASDPKRAAGSTNLSESSRGSQTGAPLTITFRDALERARRLDPQFLAAEADARFAREDRIQARAAMLPSISSTNQYLGTQGNGVLPSGRYVTNDGVHVYRVWGVVHQELPSSNLFGLAPYRRAAASEASSQAKAEIARRGLAVTVTSRYYALVVAQRKYATAQSSLEQASRTLKIGQDLERGGEVARSDVIKFQLQSNDAQRAFQEARLAMETDRLNLAVLLFPSFDQNFGVVDDLDSAQPLPSLGEITAMAGRQNPDLRAAMENLRAANADVAIAKAAFLPSFSLDLDYGIEANALALRSRVSAAPEAGRLPNLGYFLTGTISFPVWNWGSTRSKLRQTGIRRQQARAELSFAQRQLLSNLHGFYNEAEVARSEVNALRASSGLAGESLRLTTLRYQAGEATVLEVVDAQNTLTQARNAYDDGLLRYQLALAELQTLTGSF
jgi:outer membrane protein TolC